MIRNKTLRLIPFIAMLLPMMMGCNNIKDSTNNQMVTYEFLSDNFKTPDQSSGVNCWWWW